MYIYIYIIHGMGTLGHC